MRQIYIRNNTSNQITVSDIGLIIGPNATVNALDNNTIYEVLASGNLKTEVTNGTVSVYDGTSYLDITNALKHVTLETEWDDEFNVPNHTILQHTDISTPANDSVNRFLTRTNTTNSWTPANTAFNANIYGYHYGFTDTSNGYNDGVRIGWGTFGVIHTFKYLGSSNWLPTTFEIIGKHSTGSHYGQARLFDYTNNLQIAHLTWNNTSKTIISTTSLTNIPTNSAILELQVKSTQTADINNNTYRAYASIFFFHLY